MSVAFSKHASERLSDRMLGIVSAREVQAAVYEAGRMDLGETAIIIKRLPAVKVVRSSDGSVSAGDTVIAVYRRSCASDNGCVTTIELRGSCQRMPARWARVIDLTN